MLGSASIRHIPSHNPTPPQTQLSTHTRTRTKQKQVGIQATGQTETAGTVALAYAAHKAASPIRFPPTVALTPFVANAIVRRPSLICTYPLCDVCLAVWSSWGFDRVFFPLTFHPKYASNRERSPWRTRRGRRSERGGWRAAEAGGRLCVCE